MKRLQDLDLDSLSNIDFARMPAMTKKKLKLPTVQSPKATMNQIKSLM